MGAEIGWIDFSPRHRQRVGAVMDMLKPEGVVDELGVGTIRDGLADQIFPGISTIQTRAKYFFIIPYILYEYQKIKLSKQRNKSASSFLEEQEYELMWNLAEAYDHCEGNGVIGITKRRREKIMRRPSAIYWNGMVIYRFINSAGLSLDTFMSQRTSVEESLKAINDQGDDAPKDDADAEYENTFRLQVGYDPDWRNDVTLDLTRNEADFFYHRIREVAKNKLIGELVTNAGLYRLFLQYDDFMDFAKAAVCQPINESVKRMLVLAHDFSEMIYGAHITYNCRLQEAQFGKAHYNDDWRSWSTNLERNMLDYQHFNPEDLFLYAPTTRSHTQTFIYNWWEFVRGDCSAGKHRNELIEKQEKITKGNKARLVWKKLEDVKEERWIGLKYLRYRYPNAKRILVEIMNCRKD